MFIRTRRTYYYIGRFDGLGTKIGITLFAFPFVEGMNIGLHIMRSFHYM